MVFTLAAATGLRCAELFAFRINDIDFKVHRRNSHRTGPGGVFHREIGKYGKWAFCTRSRLVVYNQKARKEGGRRTMAV